MKLDIWIDHLAASFVGTSLAAVRIMPPEWIIWVFAATGDAVVGPLVRLTSF